MKLLHLLLGAAVFPAQVAASTADLAALSFEELANIRVTSVSKKSERVADAAASVFVITNEDLRRSGVTSLPEALRLAPNLHVARISGHGYAISARGFNNTYANKLLVLIDGRSVYTPLFSGVFWDAQDVMLEDVERIEVISGPGGTLWGTNAVNGVINVITRSSAKAQGNLAAAGGGNRETGGAFRHGGTAGNGVSYHLYGKYSDRDHTSTASGRAVNDAMHRAQMGFRADWSRAGDQFTMQGNAYRGAEGHPAPGIVPIPGAGLTLGAISLSGANFLARWERQLESGSRLSMQAYYDRTERDVSPSFSQTLDIVDMQFQHSLAQVGKHALVWGADFRYSTDKMTNSRYVAVLPAHLHQRWISLFVQDEMTLRDDLRLTFGGRVERNDYTGNEFLPSARLAWKFSPDHSLWTAVSRTVRAPSRMERDIFFPGTPPFLLAGGTDFRSERAHVFETGYRGHPTSRLSYSITAYATSYDDLRTFDPLPGGGSFVFANRMEGRTRGVEMWGTYQASSSWRLSGGFVALHETLTLKPGSRDRSAVGAAGKDPAHKWVLRSSLDLAPGCELDIMVHRMAALTNPDVPAYTAVDFRYGWKPHPGWELSLAGKNVIGGKHAEFSAPATRSEFGRALFVKALVRF